LEGFGEGFVAIVLVVIFLEVGPWKWKYNTMLVPVSDLLGLKKGKTPEKYVSG